MSNFLTEEQLDSKWGQILESAKFGKIGDAYKRKVTAFLLENQEKANMLGEAAPTNVTANAAKWDSVLIGMVRRMTPSLIAFDLGGVQPMSTPSAYVFAARSRYTNANGAEALFNEANSAFSGAGTHSLGGVYTRHVKSQVTQGQATVTVDDPKGLSVGMLVVGAGMPNGQKVQNISGTTVTLLHNATATQANAYLTFVASAGTGMDTATGEGDINAQMAMTIEKILVEAKTRALRAEYSVELEQDLKAVHGLNAEAELINILSNEILAEMNREFLRSIYQQAKIGAVADTTVPGVFDLQTDADGRWSAERFKGLHFAIERDANGIAFDTKRGKGNWLVVSADVASALAAANLLSFSNLETNVTSDWTQSTLVGTIGGGMKVYVDPYAEQNFYCVGYKGQSELDAGIYFAPYVPMQLYKANDTKSMQPILAAKTRYGMSSNPFFNGGIRQNGYFRIAECKNVI